MRKIDMAGRDQKRVEILKELKRVAFLLNKTWLSKKDIAAYSCFSHGTIVDFFASFTYAKLKAGLVPPTKKTYSDKREALLTALKKIAEENNGNISWDLVYRAFSTESPNGIQQKVVVYCGGLAQVAKDLRITFLNRQSWSTPLQIMKDVREIAQENGGKISLDMYKKKGSFSPHTITSHFRGGFRKLCREANVQFVRN